MNYAVTGGADPIYLLLVKLDTAGAPWLYLQDVAAVKQSDPGHKLGMSLNKLQIGLSETKAADWQQRFSAKAMLWLWSFGLVLRCSSPGPASPSNLSERKQASLNWPAGA